MNLFQIQPGTALKKPLQNYLQHHVHVFLNCQEETSCTLHELLEWFQWSNEGLLTLYIYDMCSVWTCCLSCANCQLINQHHFNKIRNACFRASFLIASISPFLWLLFCIQGPEMWGEELKRNQECTNWKIRKEASHFFYGWDQSHHKA